MLIHCSTNLLFFDIPLSHYCIIISTESGGTYNVNSQIKFKTTILKSSLYDYSDAYIHVKGRVTISRK